VGQAIRAVQHLAQFVGDQDHAATILLCKTTNYSKEADRLVVGQYGRWLVENQYLRTTHETFDDFNTLTFGDRNRVDTCVRLDAKTEVVGQFLDMRRNSCETPTPRPLRVAEQDVFGNGKWSDQLEVLMHHPDPKRARCGWTIYRGRFPVDFDDAGFRCVDPGKYIHERGFASTVFTQQAVDTARSLADYIQVLTGELDSCVVLTELAPLEPDHHREIVARRDRFEARIRAFIQSGIDDKTIRPCDPKLAGFLIMGAFNWIPTWYAEGGPSSGKEIADTFVDLLANGMAA